MGASKHIVDEPPAFTGGFITSIKWYPITFCIEPYHFINAKET